MEIGDLIFLILMGIGFLSSIGGAKKRKRGASKPGRQAPQPRQPASGTSASAPPKPQRQSRLQEARKRVKSQMEELLIQLEEQSRPKPKPSLEPAPSPVEKAKSTTAVSRLERPASIQPSPVMEDEIVVRDGTLHQQFHDKYISALSEPIRRSRTPRIKRHLRSGTLREAMIVKEILGPPKGLE